MRRVGWLVVMAMSTLASAQPRSPGPVDPWAEDPPAPPRPPDPPPPPAEDSPPAQSVEPADEPPPDAPMTSDDMIAPSEVPVDVTPPPPPYPRRFVDRPVVQPAGVNEISFSGSVGQQSVANYELTYAGSGAALSLGFPVFELNLGVFVIPLHHDNRDDLPDEVPLFQHLLASVRRQLPADFYVGVQGVLGNVGTRRQRYSPSIFVGHKFRVSENAALTVSGGLDFNFGHDIDNSDDVHATRLVGGYGSAIGLLQITPTVALRVSGTIAQYKYFDDYHFSFNDTYRLVQGGVAMLVSISGTADVSPYFSASSAGALDTYGGGLGVSIRWQ